MGCGQSTSTSPVLPEQNGETSEEGAPKRVSHVVWRRRFRIIAREYYTFSATGSQHVTFTKTRTTIKLKMVILYPVILFEGCD